MSTADGPVSDPRPEPIAVHPQTAGSTGSPAAAAVDTASVLAVGIALWCAALAVTLLVPSLHSGSRSWWPWCCAVGIVGGTLALLYVRRGRGNAAEA